MWAWSEQRNAIGLCTGASSETALIFLQNLFFFRLIKLNIDLLAVDSYLLPPPLFTSFFVPQ